MHYFKILEDRPLAIWSLLLKIVFFSINKIILVLEAIIFKHQSSLVSVTLFDTIYDEVKMGKFPRKIQSTYTNKLVMYPTY